MNKIIKTIRWSDCGDYLTQEAQHVLGKPQGDVPTNFMELLQEHPHPVLESLRDLFDNVFESPHFPDATSEAVAIENTCLFYSEMDTASALEVVLRYLDVLYEDGTFPSRWCFLDEEMKAVVHFAPRTDFCAEMYCLYTKKEAFLHMIQTPDRVEYIPVLCVNDITKYVENAKLRGSKCLKEYLPRESFSLLSRCRYAPISRQGLANSSAKQRISDDDDTL